MGGRRERSEKGIEGRKEKKRGWWGVKVVKPRAVPEVESWTKWHHTISIPCTDSRTFTARRHVLGGVAIVSSAVGIHDVAPTEAGAKAKLTHLLEAPGRA